MNLSVRMPKSPLEAVSFYSGVSLEGGVVRGDVCWFVYLRLALMLSISRETSRSLCHHSLFRVSRPPTPFISLKYHFISAF